MNRSLVCRLWGAAVYLYQRARISTIDKLKEALIKYDRLLACRALTHIVAQDRRQANSLSYLIRASFSLSCGIQRRFEKFVGTLLKHRQTKVRRTFAFTSSSILSISFVCMQS